jgi:TPR repeat protein
MDAFEIESLAAQAIEAEDYTEAQRLLEPLMAHDSEYTLVTLGWLHENGKVISSCAQLAVSLYERATKIGCLEAYNCLGNILNREGEVVRARNVYMAGAELGNLGSMAGLGAMMIWGHGGPKDVENGMLWLTKAAEKGHIYAKVHLLGFERENSKSIFRYVIYRVKCLLLGLRAGKEYYSNPFTDKIF